MLNRITSLFTNKKVQHQIAHTKLVVKSASSGETGTQEEDEDLEEGEIGGDNFEKDVSLVSLGDSTKPTPVGGMFCVNLRTLSLFALTLCR